MSSKGTWLKMLLWGIWKGIGWSAIIYIAGISSIDQQLYESAMIDGAGRFQRMWYITVPGLLPTYSVLLLLSIAGILSNGMEQYLVFSNALNQDKIQVLDLYVYNLVFGTDAGYGNIPISTVVSMSKSIISVILLFSVNSLSKVFRDGESII
jgi:putative aldouronate transport system permease protein